MLLLVHYCYRFLRTVVTIFCARLLPFSVHSLYHFLCTRNFCLHGDSKLLITDVLSKLPYWQRDGMDLAGLLPRAWAKENQIGNK